MAESVQWIRLKVGMFDGSSFKRIKRATIGGVSYRDKLTAVWFELLDLAGKSNCDGYLVGSNEIPYHSFEDIAIMLDRDEEEIEICMTFFINEKMVEIVDDVYCLTNFMQYQNQEGLAKIREQKRVSQAKWRERKKLGLVGVESTVESTSNLLSNSNSISNSNSNSLDSNSKSKIDCFNIKEVLDIYNFTDNINSAILKWLQYKKEKRQSYTKTGLGSLLKKVQEDLEQFGETYVLTEFEHSMANNWNGVYPPKEDKPKVETQPEPKAETKVMTDEEREYQEWLDNFGKV